MLLRGHSAVADFHKGLRRPGGETPARDTIVPGKHAFDRLGSPRPPFDTAAMSASSARLAERERAAKGTERVEAPAAL